MLYKQDTIMDPINHNIMFNELNELVKTNEAFYKQEFVLDSHIYWIYNYRLASYTDFLAPSALEARGIMFEVDSNGNYIRLACWPLRKFHNYKECPFTMDLDLSEVDYILEKMDGSLISSFVHNDEVRLKSKGSLFSEQCIEATKLLDSVKYIMLNSLVKQFTKLNYTVNLEYCARSDHPHRIVIAYDESSLTVLNMRNNDTGEYVPYQTLNKIFGEYTVKNYTDEARKVGIEKFIDDSINVVGFEGYVVRLPNGIMFKLKGSAYSHAHKLKSNITSSDRNLYEAVLSGASDDLRSLFSNDIHIVNKITEMEDHVFKNYNHICTIVENFYNKNKTLSRKDFAILGKTVMGQYFNLIMMLYIGKEIDIKGFMMKNYDDYKLHQSAHQDYVLVE